MIRYCLFVYLLIGFSSTNLFAQTYYVYWTESCNGIGASCLRSINRAELDGTNAVTIISNANVASSVTANDALGKPEDIKIDNINRKIYWTDSNNQNIRRSDLDGYNIELVYSATGALSQDSPANLDLDIAGGYIYWTDVSSNSPRIRRAPFNFASPTSLPVNNATVETIINSNIDQPNGIALDLTNNHVYWSDKGSGLNWIRRSDLNGGNVTTIISSLAEPHSITLDVADNKIYWCDEGFSVGNRRIRYANLDGTSPTDLVTNASDGLLSAQGIAIDLLSGTKRVYWTDIASSNSHVKRIRLSNNTVSTVATPLNYPTDVTIGVGVDCIAPRGFIRD